VRGLVQQHIASYDHFVEVELAKIIEANRDVQSEVDPAYRLQFVGIKVGTPVAVERSGGVNTKISPHECRLRDITYAAPILVDMKYPRGNYDVLKRNIVIGYLPVMLRSKVCRLRGLTPAQLVSMQECPHDPGGYFVVKGVEKVILSQEQLSKNRVIVELDNKGELGASVTSATHERKSRTALVYKGGRFYLKHNTIGDDVPVGVVFRALGVTSDLDIVTMVGCETEIQDAMAQSLEEAVELGVFTEASALHLVGGRIKQKRAASATSLQRASAYSREEEARNVLRTVVLAHILPSGRSLRPKAIYLAYMIRRVLLVQLGRAKIDDKDYYGNKRLELAGQLLSLLFEDLFKRFVGELRR